MTKQRREAAAAARVAAVIGRRKRAELLGLMRPAFARTGPWVQAGKYVGAVMSDLPKRNGWTVARYAGDRSPDRMQRLLNRASWDTFAAMGVVRRCSGWTRRHQARANWYHQRARLERDQELTMSPLAG